MVRHGSFVKPLIALCVGALLACSGGGMTAQSNLPAVTAMGAARAATVIPALTTIDTCTLSSPCISGANSGVGAGVFGSSANGRGVSGATQHNSTSAGTAMYGIYGQDLSTSGSYNAGVYGNSSRGTGVYGLSSTGTGVSGVTSSGFALYGRSNYTGLYTVGGSFGTYATATAANGIGSYAASKTGTGVYGVSSGGIAVAGNAGTGTGGEFTGAGEGVIARSSSYPLTLQDYTGHTLIYADAGGNLYLHGNVYQMNFASVKSSTGATGFSTTISTRPSVEDTGTARLINGQAIVRLDPSVARAIDSSRPYQVFLTPGGDTRGLYVAAKQASAFVVREVQGGRGTFDFDYHVYAKAASASGTMPPPHVPVAQPPAKLPALPQPSQ